MNLQRVSIGLWLAALALAAASACLGSFSFAAAPVDASGRPLSADSSAVSDDAIVERIDALIRAGWSAHDVRPSPRASDVKWQRRVTLDLVGRIPTVAELEAFAARRSRTKRVELVDSLLGEEYRSDYANHWTNVWTSLLIGRTGGRESGSVTSRTGMADYLRRSFRGNKPYDQLVRELVTATGVAQPGREGYQGAVNFLIGKMGDGAVQATAKTAQLFLGMSVQCTQCHDHPFNDYPQSQFWELNAFFRQTRVEDERMRENRMTSSASLVDVDFAGEGKTLGDDRREVFLEMRSGKLVDRDQAEREAAPIFYELRNGQVRVAFPVFVDGTRLAERFADRGPAFGNSGRVANVHRRQELARFIVESAQLERAAVNRMWSHFFGYGLTMPVDDMGLHNAPSHPELLDELARRFRAGGFDLKRLMRWIVLSEAYSLSSRTGDGNASDDPALGRSPQFSRFYVRQMQAEQLYESLLAATRADEGLATFDRDAMKLAWLDQMNLATGNDEGTESTTFNGSIPQALMMMNGELVRRACSTDAGGFLDRVANDEGLSDREKFHYLYRAALGRPPGGDETRICNDLLAARGGDVVETLQDVWWALLNSGEFILVH